jgi:hypothetical protein
MHCLWVGNLRHNRSFFKQANNQPGRCKAQILLPSGSRR